MAANYSFTILGSSSGMPQATRVNSGYVFGTGESLTQIDCGGGICSSFRRHGFDPLAVDRVLISHSHPDHCSELPLFIQMIYLSGRKERLTLYLPEEFVQPFRQFLYSMYLIPEKMPFELELVGYSDGFELGIDGGLIKAFANNHLVHYGEYIEELDLPNRMQSHCFEIAGPSKRLIYSADIRSFDDLLPRLATADIGVIESTHIDLDELFDHADAHPSQEIVITHLGFPEEVEQLRRRIEKRGNDRISVAEEGHTIPM